MQPVKITIPGSYWDSFIYKGRLYLFGIDGDIRSIVWNDLTSMLKVPDKVKIAFICAFERSDYLYSHEVKDLLDDAEIRSVMKNKFAKLAKLDLQVTDKMLLKCEKNRQDNPCPFPHADIELYKDQLYSGSAYGLYEATCNKKTKYPISARPKKKWDGPVLGLSASYGTLAMAAGSEGLFEMELDNEIRFSFSKENNIIQTSEISCRDCAWTYYSVFASSDNSGFLAEYSKMCDGKYDREADRHFERIESSNQIFGSDGYSWGIQDKICQATQNEIKVAKYQPWAEDTSERLYKIGTVEFKPWEGSVISANTASFGVVVELEKAITVFPSEGSSVTFDDEPVNWRIFPRSRYYENQLHIIYDDHLEILSFNHDYLVDQNIKVFGTSYFSRQQRNESSSLFL
jgi:hypothetical protein